MSSSSETEEIDDHPSEQWLGNTFWCLNIPMYSLLALQMHFLSQSKSLPRYPPGATVVIANQCQQHLLPRNRANKTVVG